MAHGFTCELRRVEDVMLRQLIWGLCFLFLSSSLDARPAPSYVKYDRYRLEADGYTLILSEHIPEYRPIYYTIKIADVANATIASFNRCIANYDNQDPVSKETIYCSGDGDTMTVELAIRYASPVELLGIWNVGSQKHVFTNF